MALLYSSAVRLPPLPGSAAALLASAARCEPGLAEVQETDVFQHRHLSIDQLLQLGRWLLAFTFPGVGFGGERDCLGDVSLIIDGADGSDKVRPIGGSRIST